MKRSKVPLNVCIGLAIAIVLDTFIQVLWKFAATDIPDGAGLLQMMMLLVQKPLVWGVVALFLAQLANWIKVLGHADLSYAQPITSLSYISVCILSTIFLHEVVTPMKCAGIVLILAGVWFISRGNHHTTSEVVDGDG